MDRTATAADVMTSPVITTDPKASLGEVADILLENRVSAVPVCTGDGHLAGIISETDLIKPFRDSARRKRERLLDMLAECGVLSEDFLYSIRQNTKPAGDLMCRHAITATKNTSVAKLAELMLSHGVKRIPIIENDKLVGIVSRSDLLRLIAKGAGDT